MSRHPDIPTSRSPAEVTAVTAGRPPGPPGSATDRNPRAHPWQHAPEGWQHGPVPRPPAGLTSAGVHAWNTWLGSWWAGFYVPEDLPGLVLTVKLYDDVLTGARQPEKVVPMLDRYGITPKGRQSLRWARAEAEEGAEGSGPPPADGGVDDLHARRTARQSRLA
jgi:hypothetical protein